MVSFFFTLAFSLKHLLIFLFRRWIFILEGLFTVLVGLASKFLIPDWPESAKFLREEEKQLLIARLTADVADAKMNRLDKRAYKRIFSDWKIYCGVLMYFGIVNTGYATSVSLASTNWKAWSRTLRWISSSLLPFFRRWAMDRLAPKCALSQSSVRLPRPIPSIERVTAY